MKTLSDMELRVAGFDILAQVLGILNAERFIALTIREPMDYTAWREKHMYLDDDIEAVAARAKAAAKEFDATGGDYTEWHLPRLDNGKTVDSQSHTPQFT